MNLRKKRQKLSIKWGELTWQILNPQRKES